MTLAQRQKEMIDEINAVGDCFDQYSYLILQSGLLPPFPEERRREEHLVRGCQSRVWLHTWTEGRRFRLQADSDTLIIRGVLTLLIRLLDGVDAREVAETELTLLRETELAATFTSDRSSGMGAVLRQIRQSASE